MSDLDTPFNEMRYKVQRALASNPAMPGRGEIVSVTAIPEGLEIAAWQTHAPGGVRTWKVTFEEITE